jgi:hypothetical protein
MGPKKKSGKDQEEDTSTYDLLTIYRKSCKELETPVCKVFEEKLLLAIDEEVHLPEILVNEKIEEFGARAIVNALMKTK